MPADVCDRKVLEMAPSPFPAAEAGVGGWGGKGERLPCQVGGGAAQVPGPSPYLLLSTHVLFLPLLLLILFLLIFH